MASPNKVLRASACVSISISRYYADAHIVTGNAVTVKLVLVESSTTLFSQSFQAGTFDIPRTQIIAGDNIFLTIEPSNGVYT